jgi:hypothetical protein
MSENRTVIVLPPDWRDVNTHAAIDTAELVDGDADAFPDGAASAIRRLVQAADEAETWTGESMSVEQALAIAKLLIGAGRHRTVRLHYRPFDLPDGYIAFTLEGPGESCTTFGGISPEGAIST